MNPTLRILPALATLAAGLFVTPLGATPMPPNAPASLETVSGELTLSYAGEIILRARLPYGAKTTREVVGEGEAAITEIIRIALPDSGAIALSVTSGPESIAAETRGEAQSRFPMIRTAAGDSFNRRNNAIYDRTADSLLEFPEGTVITPVRNPDGTRTFAVSLSGKDITMTFRPAYYRKHKNLPYYTPWTYSVRKDSITGWSSWWAYMRRCDEKSVASLLAVFREKKFADYGYNFIQLDDAFQGRFDGARTHSKKHVLYQGGHPDTWLDWRADLFPSGLDGYVNAVRGAGFRPALWMGCFFSDTAEPAAHPGWFVRDKSGKPAEGDWVSFVVNSRNREAMDALVRPTFRGLANAGLEYVKIDQLRHMLYDNLNNNPEFAAGLGVTNAELFRGYLEVAREELGKNTFILACWGVLPESIGIVDACRIGGDGYGPATLQQYNSWNGLVWRNDPDHCDVLPKKGGADAGNVTKLVDVQAAPNDTRIRPALASIAGAMLMLSDKPEVYRDDANLAGLRKSSPVLFSVPGQLYDYDARKTEYLRTHDRSATRGGTEVSKVDADQFGEVCPFWLNEFDAAAGHWSVLHRLN